MKLLTILENNPLQTITGPYDSPEALVVLKPFLLKIREMQIQQGVVWDRLEAKQIRQRGNHIAWTWDLYGKQNKAEWRIQKYESPNAAGYGTTNVWINGKKQGPLSGYTNPINRTAKQEEIALSTPFLGASAKSDKTPPADLVKADPNAKWVFLYCKKPIKNSDGSWSAKSLKNPTSLPPFPIKFHTVDAFIWTTPMNVPVAYLPMHSKVLESRIGPGTYVPLSIGTAIFTRWTVEAAAKYRLDTSNLNQKAFRISISVAIAEDCVFENINYLSLTPASGNLDVSKLHIFNVNHVYVSGGKCSNMSKAPMQILYDYVTIPDTQVLDVCSTKVDSNSVFIFKDKRIESIAKGFIGGGDTLGLQDALLDTGLI